MNFLWKFVGNKNETGRGRGMIVTRTDQGTITLCRYRYIFLLFFLLNTYLNCFYLNTLKLIGKYMEKTVIRVCVRPSYEEKKKKTPGVFVRRNIGYFRFYVLIISVNITRY